jgi:alpha-L-fucosidase
MGGVQRIGGLAYLPRQDGNHDGVVEDYSFESSVDGQHWTVNVERGQFWNIENNPVQQDETFAPVDARFFRFTALKSIGSNGRASAAEISVLPAEGGGGQ